MAEPAASPYSMQSRGSSSLSRTGASAGARNPILHMVNDYYTKQQAAYMQQRRRQQQQADASSVLVSPPTVSRDISSIGGVDASAISAHNVSTASARSTPPVERLLKWSEKREEALQRIREEEERKRDGESTFRPNLAKARSDCSSTSSVGGGGGDSYYSYEQLHRSSGATQQFVPEQQHAPPGGDDRPSLSGVTDHSSRDPVPNRLLKQGQLSELRKEFLRDSRNRELQSQYTFQPLTHRAADQASMHRDPSAVLQTTEAWEYKRGAISKPESPLDPECTFRPAINPPRRSNSALGRSETTQTNRHLPPSATSWMIQEGSTFDNVSSILNGTVLATPSTAQQRDHVHASNADVLEEALLEELRRLRVVCRSSVAAGSISSSPQSQQKFETFLASMCETTHCVPTQTSFTSAAYRALHDQPPQQQPHNKQKHQQQLPQREGNKIVASTPPIQQQHERDNEVLRDLSPIHRFVVTDDDALSESGLGSRSGSSVRFEVESGDDDDDEDSMKQAPAASMSLVPFDGFLVRQEQAYRAKQRRLEQLILQTAPPLKPNICEYSRQIALKASDKSPQANRGGSITPPIESTSHGGLPTSATKHLPGGGRKHAATRSDELTFRPIITQIGASCPPRGFDDMHLDFNRRQEKRQMISHKSEAEKMMGCTFQPQTNRNRNAKVESTLNPRNFALYQEQLVRQRQQQDQRRTVQERTAALEEFSHCTFKPRVNRTPSYISRMTSSVSALRDAADS